MHHNIWKKIKSEVRNTNPELNYKDIIEFPFPEFEHINVDNDIYNDNDYEINTDIFTRIRDDTHIKFSDTNTLQQDLIETNIGLSMYH